jgi:hypothetical protein
MRAGQPDLFTKRVRKPKPAAEFAIHCMVADTLRINCAPGWIWFHPPNGGERPAFITKSGKRVSPEGGKLKRMGARPGVSDILLISPAGARLHALELKAKGETPDDDQTLFMDAVVAAGGHAAWADNYPDAIRILAGWGALRTKVTT